MSPFSRTWKSQMVKSKPSMNENQRMWGASPINFSTLLLMTFYLCGLVVFTIFSMSPDNSFHLVKVGTNVAWLKAILKYNLSLLFWFGVQPSFLCIRICSFLRSCHLNCCEQTCQLLKIECLRHFWDWKDEYFQHSSEPTAWVKCAALSNFLLYIVTSWVGAGCFSTCTEVGSPMQSTWT